MRVASILSFGALAAAAPMSIDDYIGALKARQVSAPEVDNFAFYAEHAGSAYCNTGTAAGSPITCGGNCPEIEANGVTMLGTFDGADTGIAGHVAVDPARGEIVFAVRGSSNILNWITNINFFYQNTNLVSGGQVHGGFHNAWNEMAGGVSSTIASALATYPGFKVVATGHSLGGAVATIGAAYLRAAGNSVELYNYGAPRVGNGIFADFITAQPGSEYRITHLDDPVPRLPPISFSYRHTSPEYWLSVSEATGDDYPVNEVRVCNGNQNVDCNASTGGLNIDAHSTYFGPLSSCGARFVSTAADVDPELEAKVDAWAKEDIALVKGE